MTDRRSFLTALGTGGALLRTSWAQPQIGNQLFWTVETASGKVQGIANTGIKEFKGTPYGAPTGGKNRYLLRQGHDFRLVGRRRQNLHHAGSDIPRIHREFHPRGGRNGSAASPV